MSHFWSDIGLEKLAKEAQSFCGVVARSLDAIEGVIVQIDFEKSVQAQVSIYLKAIIMMRKAF